MLISIKRPHADLLMHGWWSLFHRASNGAVTRNVSTCFTVSARYMNTFHLKLMNYLYLLNLYMFLIIDSIRFAIGRYLCIYNLMNYCSDTILLKYLVAFSFYMGCMVIFSTHMAYMNIYDITAAICWIFHLVTCSLGLVLFLTQQARHQKEFLTIGRNREIRRCLSHRGKRPECNLTNESFQGNNLVII